jgi:uncharacterized repeat protein (TIGR01451 family)/CSLREA domain-containing protein
MSGRGYLERTNLEGNRLNAPPHSLDNLVLALLLALLALPFAATLAYADEPLVVTSTADDSDANTGDGECDTGSGACTLRAAIEQSNADTSITHTIEFSLTGAGPHVFTPQSALPPITHPVTIDGLSQPGASCTSWPPTLKIEIDGSNVPSIVQGNPPSGPADIIPPTGLELLAGNSTVRGLTINNFNKKATYIVFDIDYVGVGISVENSDNNTIECNFLGTEPDGATKAANQVGISLGNASGNVLSGNLVSGNGNGGSGDIGSQTAGVIIALEPQAGGESNGNQIVGNYIGTNVSGTLSIENYQDGILLVNARNSVISGNLISGNGDDGVDITDVATLTVSLPVVGPVGFSVACDTAPCATGNVIQHNIIGLASNGSALGNGNSGVEIKNAEQNRVYSNTIAYNSYQGVEVNELTAADDICTKGGSSSGCIVSNTISANSIYSNTGLGIDLTANSGGGVTPNGSGPNGANRLQNYPVISTVLTTTNALYISGVLTGAANSSFTAEFFASPVCDPAGNGEGQSFLISDTITTNSSGNAVFALTTPRPAFTQVTATATDSGGNTSEFSNCVGVSGGLDTTAILHLDKQVETGSSPARPGESITYTITVSNSGNGDAVGVVVRDDLPAGLSGNSLLTTPTLTAGHSISYTLSATILNIPTNYTATITNSAYLSHTTRTLTGTVAFTTISDTVAPAAPAPLTPTTGSTITNTNIITFGWGAVTDSTSGLAHYLLEVIGEGSVNIQGSDSITTPQTHHTPANGLANGVYSWTVRAYDNAGNISAGQTVTFTIDSAQEVYLPIVLKND